MPLSTWKITVTDTPGNDRVFGTGDLNKITRLLNGETDIGAVEIDSDFAILHDRLKLRDSTNTNEVVLNADADQSQNVTLSLPLLTADDTIMTVGGSQTFDGKSFDITTNTLTDTSPSHGDLLKYDSTFGKYIRVPMGSAGQVLQVDPTGVDVIWGSSSGGGSTSGSWDPSAAETITNKTINATNNTITDTATAAGDLLKSNATKFVRMARGSVNQVLQSTSGDLQWGLVGDANISTHTTTKISVTSKTLLNSAITYNDQNNTRGAFYEDWSQITQPTAPLSGRRRLYVDSTTSQLSVLRSDGAVISLESSAWNPNLAETLTNKTIDAASNTLKGVQVAPSAKKVGSWYGITPEGGAGLFNGFLHNLNGTASLNRDSTNGTYQTFTTGSSNTNTCATMTDDLFTARQLNPTFRAKFRIGTASGCRVDLGFISDTSNDPKNSDWLASKSGVTISYGTNRGNEVAFYIFTNNGSASSFNTGPIATVVAGTIYTIELQIDNTNSRVRYSFNGGAFTDITSQIPAASTLLGAGWGIQTTTGSSRTLDVFWTEVTSDK